MNALQNQSGLTRTSHYALTRPVLASLQDATVLTNAEHTFRAVGFDHSAPLAGTISDGGKLWIEAQKIGATYDLVQKAIVFRDTSKILFQDDPASTFEVIYSLVDIDPVRFNIRLARKCSQTARLMKQHSSLSLAQSFSAARALCMKEARAARQRLLVKQTH